MNRAASKAIGERLEEIVVEVIDELQEATVPDSFDGAPEDYWYDAQPEVAVFHSREFPMVGTCVISLAPSPQTHKGSSETAGPRPPLRFKPTRVRLKPARILGAIRLYQLISLIDFSTDPQLPLNSWGVDENRIVVMVTEASYMNLRKEISAELRGVARRSLNSTAQRTVLRNFTATLP